MAGSRISPFINTTRRSPEYAQGYRAGVKAALAWLNERDALLTRLASAEAALARAIVNGLRALRNGETGA